MKFYLRTAVVLRNCPLSPRYVEGWLESRSFTDKDGKKRDVTEVIAADVQFLDGPGGTRTDLPVEERDTTDVDVLDIPF